VCGGGGSSSWTGCSSERGFDLLQSLALRLWDKDDGEEDVEDAHGGEEPEGPGAGQKTLEEVTRSHGLQGPSGKPSFLPFTIKALALFFFYLREPKFTRSISIKKRKV